MRLLIANDLDDSLLHKVDVRAWAQRMLWFAQNEDVIITMDLPDRRHIEYVTRLTGVDPDSLQFISLPGTGRFERRMFDHHLLLDPDLLAQLRPMCAQICEVHAQWNSPLISVFLDELGLNDAWPGAGLFSQNGAEVLNNMGNFRAFATAAGVPISEGVVCRTLEDAQFHSARLLRRHRALMVKQAHAGAGAGNLLLTTDETIPGLRSGNSRREVLPAENSVALESFWAAHWPWASSKERYGVVIEQYVEDAASVYVEFFLDRTGPKVREVGELHFEEGRLAREVVPARNIPERVRTEVVGSAARLATYYYNLGHRGFLSADVVVTRAGKFTFTEVNAQFTGSSHLYNIVANKVVGAWERGLSVTQMTSPLAWQLSNLPELLEALEQEELAFTNEADDCIIPITPCIGDRGVLILAVVRPIGEDPAELLDRVGTRLARRNAIVS